MSALFYTLNKLSEDGHCYATRKMLLEKGAELLGVEDNLLAMTLDEMIRAKDVITDNIPRDDVHTLSAPAQDSVTPDASKGTSEGISEEWHGILQARELTAAEQQHIVDVIMKWIQKECS